MFFETGKLPFELLNEMTARYGSKDPSVILPPGPGRDAAVIDIGHSYLVAKSDPIIFATDAIGWYVVHINANDIACMGATPRWFLVTLMFPESGTDRALVEKVFAQMNEACEQLGVTLVGGHSEIAYGVDRVIVSGHMLGIVEKEKLVTPANAREGDCILLANSFPIEATGLIAREKAKELKQLGFTEAEIQQAAQMIFDPGISVVKAAGVATSSGTVHSMHDPTEGGVATGIVELALGSGLGADIEFDALPCIELGARICSSLGLDPLGAFASGSLLLTVPADSVAGVMSGLAAERITASKIGVLTAPGGEIRMRRDGKWIPVPHFHRDEVAKLF